MNETNEPPQPHFFSSLQKFPLYTCPAIDLIKTFTTQHTNEILIPLTPSCGAVMWQVERQGVKGSFGKRVEAPLRHHTEACGGQMILGRTEREVEA